MNGDAGGGEEGRLRDLDRLMVYPSESLQHEYKSWLDLSDNEHRALLAKSMIAHANSGGGFVIVGFRETSDGLMADPDRPDDLSGYDQDNINGIVARFAEPAFHCDVAVVSHPESGDPFPVVTVPGNHSSPIRAKRAGPNGQHITHNSYYIRRPGPASEEPQSGREWDELVRRCVLADRDQLLDELRQLIDPRLIGGRQEPSEPAILDRWVQDSDARWSDVVTADLGDLSRFTYGTYTFAYRLRDVPEQLDGRHLLEALREAEGPETGWPMFWIGGTGNLEPYPYQGLVECWLGSGEVFPDPAHSDFWQASPEGSAYIRRGYQEDSDSNVEPGTIFDLTLPVWRTAEVLTHARRLAESLDVVGVDAEFLFRWQGLEGRRLRPWTSSRILSVGRVCRQDEVITSLAVATDEIDGHLAELTEQATGPLYEAFEFFSFAAEHHREEVQKFLGRGRS